MFNESAIRPLKARAMKRVAKIITKAQTTPIGHGLVD